jgi:predicted DNA-binding transcriptional regulator
MLEKDSLIALGFSKNEAELYLALLEFGALTASELAVRSGVHRRNVYDCVDRLLSRGLIVREIGDKGAVYRSMPPRRIAELLQEQQEIFTRVLPQLEQRYRSDAHDSDFYLYSGIEGWKQYMRDIIRVGEAYYCIGGKGGWMDSRVGEFFPSFVRQLRAKRIRCFTLFDAEVYTRRHSIQRYVGRNFRFLPPECSSTASVEIFGDHVVFVTDLEFSAFRERFSLAVMRNRQLADAYRKWFQLMWKQSTKAVQAEKKNSVRKPTSRSAKKRAR